jgi:hypothetical protein
MSFLCSAAIWIGYVVSSCLTRSISRYSGHLPVAWRHWGGRSACCRRADFMYALSQWERRLIRQAECTIGVGCPVGLRGRKNKTSNGGPRSGG